MTLSLKKNKKDQKYPGKKKQTGKKRSLSDKSENNSPTAKKDNKNPRIDNVKKDMEMVNFEEDESAKMIEEVTVDNPSNVDILKALNTLIVTVNTKVSTKDNVLNSSVQISTKIKEVHSNGVKKMSELESKLENIEKSFDDKIAGAESKFNDDLNSLE